MNAQLAGELSTTQQNLQGALRNLANGEPQAAETLSLPLRPFRGDLPWPVAGSVRRRFSLTAGARGVASNGGTASNGVEIAAAEGSKVEAIHEGIVAFADTFAGYGNLVILDHGSQAFSLYGNLLDIAVKRGARVDRGEAIGTVGPSALGPAGLYFELRIDGQPADPLQWLRKR